MGQCGCGERPFDTALKLKPDVVLGIRVYDGCGECFAGLGVDISAFTSSDSEWLEFADLKEMDPDEYGGHRGSGFAVGLFEVEDLKVAVNELNANDLINEYGGIEDWLDDYGLELIQAARRSFEKRMKARRKP